MIIESLKKETKLAEGSKKEIQNNIILICLSTNSLAKKVTMSKIEEKKVKKGNVWGEHVPDVSNVP